jgi:hypothetical protein
MNAGSHSEHRIRSWDKAKYECGREDAIRRAVEERQRDANEW